MARTCIICGGPTGSREHIFPAALGGRRTNKGIYCADHNNEYAGLAGMVSGQLALFNAQIGVVGDHASETTPVTMTDLASGREIKLTNSQVRFKSPQIISQEIVGKTIVAKMSFNSVREAEDWILEKKAQGFDVQPVAKKKKRRIISRPRMRRLSSALRRGCARSATSHRHFWHIHFLISPAFRSCRGSRITL
jgi:hypothetical protein